jgi:hypothetical protein
VFSYEANLVKKWARKSKHRTATTRGAASAAEQNVYKHRTNSVTDLNEEATAH